MGIEATLREKFRIIREKTSRDDNLQNMYSMLDIICKAYYAIILK